MGEQARFSGNFAVFAEIKNSMGGTILGLFFLIFCAII